MLCNICMIYSMPSTAPFKLIKRKIYELCIADPLLYFIIFRGESSVEFATQTACNAEKIPCNQVFLTPYYPNPKAVSTRRFIIVYTQLDTIGRGYTPGYNECYPTTRSTTGHENADYICYLALIFEMIYKSRQYYLIGFMIFWWLA